MIRLKKSLESFISGFFPAKEYVNQLSVVFKED
jgi:hypothetical protein